MPRFEFYAADVDAAKAFYTGLFGWSFTPVPGLEAFEYHLASGKGVGAGGLTVGLERRPDATPAAGSAVRGGVMSFDVEDCDASYAWALANGGAEALPPTDYPGIGRAAYVEDGEGNIVGMITPAQGDN